MQPSFHDSEEEEALSISINLADCNEGEKKLPYLSNNQSNQDKLQTVTNENATMREKNCV